MARLYTNNSIISTLSTQGVDLPTDRRKLSKVGWVRLRGCLIWPPENGRHEAVSGGSPELPGVVVR
ncbi:hypothetical protein, partial [Stenotrophomonas maltophilia]|uniref:hypothetical protein n=1 Tax=Stenotrophomonas maltophilia TaxID=40324 RepID=UPI001FA7CB7D